MSARSLALYASSSSSSNVALAARPTLCRPAFRAVRRSSIVDVRGGWTVYRSPPSAPRGRHLTSPLSSWRWATSRALSGGSLPTGGSAEFSALLSAHQRDLVQRERSVLLRLHENLVAFGTDTEQLLVLRDVIAQMEELFMVCVVGEFNAGKSSFVNALLGGRHAEEGVLPTTAVVAILRHGERESRSPSLDASGLPIEDVEDVRLPVEWLKQCCIVDTPGTNAIVARHEQLTQRIVPRADIVIFVTSADRPFSESERAFLQTIKQYHKKVVIVVNKCDIVRTEPEVTAVLDFVRTHGRALLGHAPKVFGVSAQLALDAKLAAGDASPTLGAGAAQWERSRFAHLEAHMRELLSAEERVARKLLTPLGVGEQVTSDALARLAQRKQVLHGDLATLSLIESNMQAFADDMERDLKHERAQIAKTVEEMVARADSWFSANISILNAHMLLTDAGKFEATFRDEVLGSTSERIDEIVTDMSTLVERRARAQSRAVLEFLGRRPGEHTARIVGTLHDGHFEGVRESLLSKLAEHVHEELATYDGKSEASKISKEVQQSLMSTALIEVGALSVGGLVAAHLLDVTGGVITASGLVVLGLLVLPRRAAQQKAHFRARANEVVARLDEALAQRLEREMYRIQERIMSTIDPYARFVRVEDQKLGEMAKTFENVQTQIRDLRLKI